MLLTTGCVSLRENQREIRDARIQVLQHVRKLAHYQHCDGVVSDINKMLVKEEAKP